MNKPTMFLPAVVILLAACSAEQGANGRASAIGEGQAATVLHGMSYVHAPCGNTNVITGCPRQPIAMAVSVYDEEGAEVATLQPGAAGEFEVSLPAGRYRVVPESNRLLRAEPMDVILAVGETKEIEIRYVALVR